MRPGIDDADPVLDLRREDPGQHQREEEIVDRPSSSESIAIGPDATRRKGIHHLRCWPAYFADVRRGDKPFEIRRADRDFQVGDVVLLEEWDPDMGAARDAEGYTGQTTEGTITCVVVSGSLPDFLRGAVGEGFAVLGVRWRA
jgi:hypothetical protein